jgi:tetratricopeptide (TPR) repeat protein
MTSLILYVLLWIMDNRNFDSITKANERKLGAEKFYAEKQYINAAELYHQITYGSIFSEPAARLNMAHSYFLAQKYSLALQQYRLLRRVNDKRIASVANQQIALIKVSQKDTASALASLKEALKIEPGNDIARHNFIILKNKYSGLELMPDRKVVKNKTEQMAAAPVPPATVPTNMEVEENVKRDQLLRSLNAMNMSEDQARAILDAMKSNESQYIYQLRRRQYAKKTEQNEQIEW